MQKYQNNLQTRNGLAIVGATVRVFTSGTTTLATLYEDNESTPKTNPLTTDNNGEFSFKAADGEYDISVDPGVGHEGKSVTEITLEDLSDGFSALASTDSGKGAELVGFVQSGIATTSRTVSEKLSERRSVLDYVGSDLSASARATLVAAMKAGTNTTDLSPYVQDAV